MSGKESTNNSGVGFFGLLGIMFIGLKLAGFIDWPWWLVLSPIWGSFLAVVLIAVIAVVVASIKE